MSASRIYFVISCARSGSTSLSKILDTASNGCCLMEPMPNLNVESRDLIDHKLQNPRKVLVEQVLPRVADGLEQGLIYGEKNVTLAPFIPYLYEMLRCKFVFLMRDGRDVATSLMNWHNEAFGSIYRECREQGVLSDVAKKAVANLPIDLDTSDYSRPRPHVSDPFYKDWKNFSRFEMVTWYWAYINRLIAKNLNDVPKEDWILIDYTGVQADDIRRVFDFLHLDSFNETRVGEALNARINSVQDRFKMQTRFPYWQSWDSNLRQQFDRIASGTMQLLGYYQ